MAKPTVAELAKVVAQQVIEIANLTKRVEELEKGQVTKTKPASKPGPKVHQGEPTFAQDPTKVFTITCAQFGCQEKVAGTRMQLGAEWGNRCPAHRKAN